MPHVMLDYSANLEDAVDIADLCSCLRLAAIETGVFPMAGIRVRAFAATHVSIADGDAQHGYIDISVRLREGRDLATRQAAPQRFLTRPVPIWPPAWQNARSRCRLRCATSTRSFRQNAAPSVIIWRKNSVYPEQQYRKTGPVSGAFSQKRHQNLINGKSLPAASGATFETCSPVDKSVICPVAQGGAADVDAAAEAAKAACPAWRDMAAAARKKILIKIAEGIEARAEEIAFCECWDTGQTLRFMSKAALRAPRISVTLPIRSRRRAMASTCSRQP